MIFFKIRWIFFVQLFLSVLIVPTLYAQEKTIAANASYRVDFGYVNGTGTDNFIVGQTTSGDEFGISAGGGTGNYFSIGKCIDLNVDIEVAFGSKNSVFIPSVSNSTGDFERTYILTSVKFKSFCSKNMQVKLQ